MECSIDEATGELRRILQEAVIQHIDEKPVMGCWLSGGLDSSLIAALARPTLEQLHTFAVGLEGAPDLEHARVMAKHIDAVHHELVLKPSSLEPILPEVIEHLESFDTFLVRSSVVNYLTGKMAADYVQHVFSGEGGDELFAGYAYLKEIPLAELGLELMDIIQRLHNTALQRVDRCSASFGLIPHVCYLGPEVVAYALRIPTKSKIYQGVEKWILRQVAERLLPPSILHRGKSKFWQGSGVGTFFEDLAVSRISDREFVRGKHLPNGWLLRSKEELLYYRIFRECFGDMESLEWMGRTKLPPRRSKDSKLKQYMARLFISREMSLVINL